MSISIVSVFEDKNQTIMNKIANKKSPDFIGVGVQRAGTSWLYECLKEHNEIFLPQKEVHFFNKKFDKGIEWYHSLFDTEDKNKVTGEFTPDYLSNEFSINKIAELCPHSKLILVLRDPFDRAYSAYNLYVAHGNFKGMSFQEAIAKDPQIINQSLYSAQIERVLSLFPSQQIKIYDFDDISARPSWLLNDLYKYLGVNSDFKPSRFNEKFNVSGMSQIQNKLNLPKIQMRLLHSRYGRHILKLKRIKLIRKLKAWVLDRKSDENFKAIHCSAELRETFKKDLIKTSELLGRNYEKWY